MLKTSLIAAGLAGLVLCTQPAAAQAPANPELTVQHRLVPYADLDLTTKQGQARLDSRLRRAASAVCDTNTGPHPLNEAMAARRCYRDALQSAQRTMASLGTVKVAAR
ncbi:MAG: UrcA family protein [Novosphingobium sp.]|uniref:UrcA family protein n=1 Tax=Novosphingobium sp. TaxID=1874826 RepID=UPI003017F5B9